MHVLLLNPKIQQSFSARETMDYTFLALFLSSMCLFLAVVWPRRNRKLPPGPLPFPIVGNLLKLGTQPHKSLAELAKIHGPLMSLQLGSITIVVASSPAIAKEILQKNDQAFARRTVPDSLQILNHQKFSLVWMPNSPLWRDMRKMFNTKLFLAQRLEANKGLRRRKVDELLAYVDSSCKDKRAVEIAQAAFSTSLNLISNTVFSIDLTHLDSRYAQEFKTIVSEILVQAAKPNFSDYFPILRSFDPQGIRGRMEICFGKLDEIFDRLIKQRLESRESGKSTSVSDGDFLDTMLDYKQEDGSKLCDLAIKALLKDIFIAGTDTTSSTVEWAMTELLRNPTTMEKAQGELRDKIGHGKPIDELDIDNLPYLQAVVKETFRLHPPAPFLIPHRAEHDVEIGEFVVPKDAQVIVNVWILGRDPNVWEQPTSFLPERFLNSNIDFKGRDFELIPFGAGRRICPGLPLAYRMLHLMLASLLHAFDWKLEDGLKPHEIDVEENFGITLQKATPLKVIPFKV